jgi:hypothetical protein
MTTVIEPPVLPEEARLKYVNGRKFIVVRPGARLEGLLSFGPSAWAGYQRELEVGEVITCLGWKLGYGTESVMVTNWTAESVPDNVEWLQVWPVAGMWRPYPADGYLAWVEEKEN